MSKNVLIASLTLISVIFGTAIGTKAELAPNVNSLTIKTIERSNDGSSSTQPNSNRPQRNNRRVATNSRRSMNYVKLGWEAQKNNDNDQALLYYYKAVKADKTNAYAFMAAGNLLGETDDGITCMKAAVALFKQQGNQEGYNVSLGWLEEHGAAE